MLSSNKAFAINSLKESLTCISFCVCLLSISDLRRPPIFSLLFYSLVTCQKNICWKPCFVKEKKKKRKKKEGYLFVFFMPFLSLRDLFDCIAVLGSSFRRFGQCKPCHNSKFLTGLQLPGQAAADQHWINAGDKQHQSQDDHR